MSVTYTPEVHRIHTRHLTGFHLTDPQPTPATRWELDKAAEIVVAHVAEQCHRADHSGDWRPLPTIHALITLDLGGATLRREGPLGDLVDAWPWDGEFPTAEARDDYEQSVRDYLTGHGFTRKAGR